MSRDEQLRSAGLALEEHAALKRKCAAMEAEIMRHGKAASLFSTFHNHLLAGSDNGWSLDELKSLPDGSSIQALIREWRDAKAELAKAAERLKDLGY